MFKKISRLFLSALIVFSLFSCASTQVPVSEDGKAVLTKEDNQMFWTINGTDKNGKQSTIYVLGTFHAGDDRIYPLSEKAEKAFKKSDRYVSEIATDEYLNIAQTTQTLMFQSIQRETKRIEETQHTWFEQLTPEQLQFIGTLVQTPEELGVYASCEPWALNSVLQIIPIMLTSLVNPEHPLDPNNGLDDKLINRLNEKGIKTIGLDTSDLQFDIITFGSYEQQIDMVKSSIDELLKDATSIVQDLIDLYEGYITGDVEKVSELMDKDNAKNDKDYEKELNKLIITDRNVKWAKTFEEFLNEGGTTFIFAGCAHFVGDDSVFAHMKENGVL